VDLRDFAQVLVADLPKAVPGHHVMPPGLMDFVTALVGVGLVGREGHVADGRPALRVARLGIAPEVADENYPADASCRGRMAWQNGENYRAEIIAQRRSRTGRWSATGFEPFGTGLQTGNRVLTAPRRGMAP
jgi:hypothetical protein